MYFGAEVGLRLHAGNNGLRALLYMLRVREYLTVAILILGR